MSKPQCYKKPRPYTLYEEGIVANDIKTKMMIARNVIHACVNGAEQEKQNSKSNLCSKVQYFTGISEDVAFKLLNGISNSFYDRTFKDWYDENDRDITETQNEFSGRLREVIVDHYVHKKSLPTLGSIAKNFEAKDIMNTAELKKRLRDAGYLWKRVPGTPKTIIVEKPERLHKRQAYLEAIKKYREDNVHMVYLDEKFIDQTGHSTDHPKSEKGIVTWFCMAVSRNLGIISHALSKKVSVEEFTSILEEWIISLVQSVGVHSVFVFEEKSHHDKSIINTPTMHSSGMEMIQWLKFFNIPHNPEWHRSELFKIINYSKKKFPDKMYKLDEFLHQKGHRVLRRPRDNCDLDYFKPFWHEINTKKYNFKNLEAEIEAIMALEKSRNWDALEKLLIKKENKIYQEDIEVETAIDKLLFLAKYDEKSRPLFDDCDEEIDETKLSKIILL